MARAPRLLALFLALLAVAPRTSPAQTSPPKHEFRGAWMATVANLDWPTSQTYTTAQQQAQMIQWLDALKAAGINAVLFQVRPEADAFFESPYEPWSAYLTGSPGQAPAPYYDPLAFAIEEAHKRGMELHAWFNPYRVWISSRGYDPAPSSVYNTKPEWLLHVPGTQYTLTILNPGVPDVRSYVADVIRDVVTRYDVDGVHFDDYFYPYPEYPIGNLDWATYQQYGSGFQSITAWRTFNVNMLVKGVWDMLQEDAPDVKFGISPFGIWKSGTPTGIVGLSGATDLYADAVVWMEQGWLDYLTPQLYWPFPWYDNGTWYGTGQDYGKLAPWWAEQVNGRHLYPGHGLYRSDRSTYSGTLFSSSEIPNQVRFNREHDIPGSVFFRTRNITSFSSKGFADTLSTDLYRYPALTPVMDWKDLRSPGPPTEFTASAVGTEVTLSWTPPVPDGWSVEARFYSVYRYRGVDEPDWEALVEDPSYLAAVIGDTTWVDHPEDSETEPYWYTVRAVSANSVESGAATGQSVIATGIESDLPVAFRMEAPFPNPFRHSTTVRYALPRAGRVTITVHDVLGREVARLADGILPSSEHDAVWDATGSASGTYFVVMRFEGKVESRGVVLLR